MNHPERPEVFICECGSHEHQFSFWYDADDNNILLTVHLAQYKGLWSRLWAAVRYVFGYKSRFGDFDCTIINRDDTDKLINTLQKLKP